MSDFYGSYFEYAGFSSRYVGLIIASVETSRITNLFGEEGSISVYSKSANKRYLVGNDYSASPLSFDIEFVVDDGKPINPEKRRRIERWLFNQRNYSKLYFDTSYEGFWEAYETVDGKVLRNYFNCRFLNPQKLEYNGGIVGYKATLEADSNMFWQDPTVTSFDVVGASNEIGAPIDVEVDSDFRGYVYPKVIIDIGSEGGDIDIVNETDDGNRYTSFVDLSADARIIMNGEINHIEGQYYEKFRNRNFIRLLNGSNRLLIMGDVARIKIEFSNRRAL